MSLHFIYDAEADAAYLRLGAAAAKESEEVTSGLVFDYDERGAIVGMEVLQASRRLSPEALVRGEDKSR